MFVDDRFCSFARGGRITVEQAYLEDTRIHLFRDTHRVIDLFSGRCVATSMIPQDL